MPLVDWRELYAANRAAIADAGVGLASAPAPGVAANAGAGVPPPARPVTPSSVGPSAPTAHLGPGRWDELPLGKRAVFLYTPPGLTGAEVPLLVMLHGCTQTAAALAAGTRMNALADREGFVVAYPQQTRAHNPGSCWNWFKPAHQRRGGPEPAHVAAVVDAVAARARIDRRRAFLAGMSAGAAMAAVVAATYPDVFAAVALHSGVAYGAAEGQRDALRAMRSGARTAPLGALVVDAMGARARRLPALVLHGEADRTVAPVNGEQLVAQWLAANALADHGVGTLDPAAPASDVSGTSEGGRRYVHRRWVARDGRPVVEHVRVEGLGHAWSGGAPGGSYTDPRGPSAAETVWRFFREATASERAVLAPAAGA